MARTGGRTGCKAERPGWVGRLRLRNNEGHGQMQTVSATATGLDYHTTKPQHLQVCRRLSSLSCRVDVESVVTVMSFIHSKREMYKNDSNGEQEAKDHS